MKYCLSCLFVIFLLLLNCSESSTMDPEPDPQPQSFMTPQEAIGQMIRGINIGNTLEPPFEGDWNNGPLQEYYFDDYKSAGFTCVRVPVRWGTHTTDLAPFTVDGNWMNRVEQVVDWGLARGLFIIINGHHEDWLKQDYSATNQARYDSIWSQIATRFQSKSDKLLFEIINEPFGLTRTQVDQLNARVLGIIRKTNPQRIVIFSGNDYSNLSFLLNAAIPQDDYLMGYYHSYDPWSFAGQGTGTWGTEADRNANKSAFEQAAAWSATNNIPVMISEFGAVRYCEYNSRMLHYFTYVENAVANNVAFQAWDDGGDFGIYDRANRSWPEVKDILLHTYPESPTSLVLTTNPDVSVLIAWQNRRSSSTQIIIERRTNDTDFAEIAQLAGDVSQYLDTTPENNTVYYYRVISKLTDQPDMYSYPRRIFVATTPN